MKVDDEVLLFCCLCITLLIDLVGLELILQIGVYWPLGYFCESPKVKKKGCFRH